MPLMSFLAYSRHRGVSKVYIQELAAKGLIPIVTWADGKRIKSEVADKILDAKKASGLTGLQRYHAERRQAKALRLAQEAARSIGAPIPTELVPGTFSPATPAPVETPPAASDAAFLAQSLTAADSRAKKERYAAQSAEVEYRRMVGELVERASVERAISQCATLTRNLVERLPDRTSERIAAALGVDPAKAHALLAAEVTLLCREIAGQIAALGTRLAAGEPTPVPEPETPTATPEEQPE